VILAHCVADRPHRRARNEIRRPDQHLRTGVLGVTLFPRSEYVYSTRPETPASVSRVVKTT
jgi:hypothetical protein